MQLVFLALIFYFFVGAGVCLLICVNPNDPGILGRMSHFLFKKLPPLFNNLVSRIFGQRVLSCLGGVKTYLMETNHPIVQIFYLIIAVGGFIAYEILGIFKHMPNNYIGDFHVILANFLALICFWIYYKACAVSPGQITQQNNKRQVDKYDSHYNEIVYRKNNKCKTCNIVKPARSKHCSICKMCVAKFDHHCIWIRQCVGQKNYKYFISFLFLHGVWCLYLSAIGAVSLADFLDRMNFMRMSFRIDGQIVQATPLLALQYLFMTETVFFFLIVMCFIMGATLIIFVTYHFYLVGVGQTTNERIKINDEIDYLKKQIKNVQKLQKTKQQKSKQLEYRGQKITISELQEYKSECQRRLAILQKPRANNGFIRNLMQVYRL